MEFSVQMRELLDSYNEDVQKSVMRIGREVSAEAVRKLRSVSFKTNKKGYSSGWRTKREGNTFIVHNEKMPGLTHLLENGHVAKNQYGTYERVPAVKHIEPVEQEANEEFIKRVEESL